MKNKNTIVAILIAFTILLGGLLGSVPAAFADETVDCNAKAALLMDGDTGKIVFEKNIHTSWVKSVVKCMSHFYKRELHTCF